MTRHVFRFNKTNEKMEGISLSTHGCFNIYRDTMEEILRVVYKWSEDKDDTELLKSLEKLRPEILRANWNPLID